MQLDRDQLVELLKCNELAVTGALKRTNYRRLRVKSMVEGRKQNVTLVGSCSQAFLSVCRGLGLLRLILRATTWNGVFLSIEDVFSGEYAVWQAVCRWLLVPNHQERRGSTAAPLMQSLIPLIRYEKRMQRKWLKSRISQLSLHDRR